MMTIAEAEKMIEENLKYAMTQEWITDKWAWALGQTWKEAERRKGKHMGRPPKKAMEQNND